MQVNKILIRLVAVAFVALPCGVWAQKSSINAFSPYSMYGIGELNTQGTLPTRSMGGVGVAVRMPAQVNLINPAAFSTARRKSFLFDFGIENQNYYNLQNVAGQRKRSSYNTVNFHEVAFQLPLAKGLGFGFGLTPYSSVGYKVRSSQIDGNYGWSEYTFQGDGDITEVKAGIGWEVFKGFSIGAAVQYYWGAIDRTYIMTPTNIVDNTVIAPSIGSNQYEVSRFKGQFGFQWAVLQTEKRYLSVGATYDIGGDLRPAVSRTISVGNTNGATVVGDTTHMALSLPHQVAAGIYFRTPKVALGVDYVYQNWRSNNATIEETTAAGYTVAYANTNTFKVGVEYTPDYADTRRLMNRISYRAGFRYGDYNQTFNGQRITQYAITAGFGIPIRFLLASAIDVGFEFGSRGAPGNIAADVGFVKQRYFKVALGISIFASPESKEYWFVRPKYD